MQVTPLELEVALGKREWDGFYSTDFDDVPGLTAAPLPPPQAVAITSDDGNNMSSKVSVATSPADGNRFHANESGSTIGNACLAQNGDLNIDDDSDGDQPFFSLVTGTYKNVPKAYRHGRAAEGRVAVGRALPGSDVGDDGGALVGIGDRSLVEWNSPAADFLRQREYQGLEALIGQTEAAAAIEGQTGIASDYAGV